MKEIQNYINGKFQPPAKGRTIDDTNPATGEIIGTVPASTSDDVQQAVDAANGARTVWASLAINERVSWLDKIANSLESQSEKIASLESLDTGKPISLARAVDAARSVTNFRFFAKFAKDYTDEKFEMEDAVNHVILKPVDSRHKPNGGGCGARAPITISPLDIITYS